MTLFAPPAAVALTRAAPFLRCTRLLSTVALMLFILPATVGCSQQAPSSNATAASSGSSGSDPVVAKINGVEVRESDLAIAADDLGQELQNAPPEMRREHVLSYLADIIIISQAGEQKKLGDAPDFKQRLAFMRNKLLMGAMMQSEVKGSLTEEAMRETYDTAVKSMAGQEEVRARHILVDSEDEAKALVEQIKGGADFAALAKEKSKDPGSSEGGDLGYFTKEQMVPEFSEVAFKMYPGQVSNPVKSQFGWHVIKVEDKRNRPVPDFDRVKDQIEAFLTRKAQNEFVGKLRQSAKVERLDRPATPSGMPNIPGLPPGMMPPGMLPGAPPAETAPPAAETPAPAPPAEPGAK